MNDVDLLLINDDDLDADNETYPPVLNLFEVNPVRMNHPLDEDTHLDGDYKRLRYYHNNSLRWVRNFVKERVKNKKRIHVIVGSSYASLYMAYCVTLYAKCEIEVTFLDVKSIGGKSIWAQMHPLLLHQFVVRTVEKSEVSFMSREDLEHFAENFRRIPHEYSVISVAEEEEATHLEGVVDGSLTS